ncbi:hypothetical protein P171DRAFT_436476 [Karstenula rhodostoma CBS 690.94]|uniref:Uncharacterized protein n=1 Tax=Karstenula rhodostoma CBS 690.94 TaxID=1392251 RepID=A0A9P4U7G3_9PLEO|nr:hypothetical protein P171DRAFT_436476 [Karstenula rhodostoma CBS 690.94]
MATNRIAWESIQAFLVSVGPHLLLDSCRLGPSASWHLRSRFELTGGNPDLVKELYAVASYLVERYTVILFNLEGFQVEGITTTEAHIIEEMDHATIATMSRFCPTAAALVHKHKGLPTPLILAMRSVVKKHLQQLSGSSGVAAQSPVYAADGKLSKDAYTFSRIRLYDTTCETLKLTLQDWAQKTRECCVDYKWLELNSNSKPALVECVLQTVFMRLPGGSLAWFDQLESLCQTHRGVFCDVFAVARGHVTDGLQTFRLQTEFLTKTFDMSNSEDLEAFLLTLLRMVPLAILDPLVLKWLTSSGGVLENDVSDITHRASRLLSTSQCHGLFVQDLEDTLRTSSVRKEISFPRLQSLEHEVFLAISQALRMHAATRANPLHKVDKIKLTVRANTFMWTCGKFSGIIQRFHR